MGSSATVRGKVGAEQNGACQIRAFSSRMEMKAGTATLRWVPHHHYVPRWKTCVAITHDQVVFVHVCTMQTRHPGVYHLIFSLSFSIECVNWHHVFKFISPCNMSTECRLSMPNFSYQLTLYICFVQDYFISLFFLSEHGFLLMLRKKREHKYYH